MINARGETLAEKPSFRAAFRRRRCLVLADGFYEWQAVQDGAKSSKIPVYIQLNQGAPFAFAGLWENWHSPDGSQILSCTIITTSPNELLSPIHNRMPVILPPENYRQWLDPQEQDPKELAALIKPFPSGQMTAYPVSKLVNNPNNDVPACIQPIS